VAGWPARRCGVRSARPVAIEEMVSCAVFPGPWITLVAGATLANGFLGILHSLVSRVPGRTGHLAAILPYGVHHWKQTPELRVGNVKFRFRVGTDQLRLE